MKLKLDENLGERGRGLLEAALINALRNRNLDRQLWIVELGRIREYSPDR